MPERFFHLRQAELPHGVIDEPVHTPIDRQSRPRLTPAVLKNWIDDALASLPCGAGDEPLWVTLQVDSTSVRMSEPPPSAALLDSGEGEPVAVPVLLEDGAAWLAGPLAAHPHRPPVRLEFSQCAGSLRLTVAVHWSPWAGDGLAAARLGQALQSLLAMDWRREATS